MRAMNRRTFIGTSIAAAVAASRPAWPAEPSQIERVGLQLYTVRDLMKKDFEGTVAKVAQIGYKEVEFAGYFDKTPQGGRSSMQKDVAAGNPPELDGIAGPILRRAEEHGIDVPVTRELVAMIRGKSAAANKG